MNSGAERRISEPLKMYQETELQNASVLAMMVGLAIPQDEKDEFLEKLEKAQYEGRGSKRLQLICEKISELPNLSTFDQFILEMSFCRSVDNFLTYISDMLTLLFVTKKNYLTRFSKSVDTDLIVEKDNVNEIIHEIVEREVMSLSHRNIKDLSKFLGQKDKLKIKMFKDEAFLDAVSTFVEIRNLMVHNRGYITRSALKRSRGLRNLGAPAGSKPRLTGEFMTWVNHILPLAAIHFEDVMCKKFGLPQLHDFNDEQTEQSEA